MKITQLKDDELNDIMKIKEKENEIEQFILIKNDIECKTHQAIMSISKTIKLHMNQLNFASDTLDKHVLFKWSNEKKADHIELMNENILAIHASFKSN